MPSTISLDALTRRTLLQGAAGLVVGAGASGLIGARALGATNDAAHAEAFNAFVTITADDQVIITSPGAEMGQGVVNSLPKIIAEELCADWDRVEVRLSGADARFNNPANKQRSANSDAVVSYYAMLRRIGAATRSVLVEAAARHWNVEPASITAKNGRLHRASGESLPFGAMAAAAAQLPVPQDPPLKSSAEHELLGRDFPRKDLPAKVDGSAVFGMDVSLPGMLYASIRHSPCTGLALEGYADEAALGAPGVHRVVALDNAVAVIADSYWQAEQAANLLELSSAQGGRLDTAQVRTMLREGLEDEAGFLPFPVTDTAGTRTPGTERARIDEIVAGAAVTFEADYEVPYLAHATMETLCSTALWADGRCEIWAPTQAGNTVAPKVAEATGIAPERITVHRTYLGGGFGRKFEPDFVIQSVQLAMTMPGRPVMLVWPREEDTRHDCYRPAFMARTRAGIDDDGRIRAMRSRISGQSLTTMKDYRVAGRADASVASDLVPSCYAIDERRIEHHEIATPLTTGYWRSVSASHNLFFTESAIDEIAAKLGRDPLDYRLQLAAHDPRAVAVLEAVRAKSGWDTPPGPGRGRGVALGCGWGARAAWVIEASIAEQDGAAPRLQLNAITCVFDCGTAIEPDTVKAQIEGGIVYGLSAALFGEITLSGGQIEQASYADYPVVLMEHCPPIAVHLLDSGAAMAGVGEAGVPGVAPALASAIAQANGRRLRRLPLVNLAMELRA